ncbi:MAG: ABC transporter permease [Kouleothrix sp.]
MFKEQLIMALDSLRANTCSLLTMLGIIIGASTLVAVLSLGNAASQVFEQFIDLGTRRVVVQPGDPNAKGARDVPGYGLTIADYRTLEQVVAQHPEIFRTIARNVDGERSAGGTVAVQSTLTRRRRPAAAQTTPVAYGRFPYRCR